MTDVALADLPVWTFKPNWDSDVLERFLFMTDIMASNTGVEQRRGSRLTPRRQFDCDVLLEDAERAAFDLFVMGPGGGDFLLPVWHDMTGLTAAALAGDGDLSLPTDGREYVEGAYALLIVNALSFERVQIDTITSDAVTLVDPLANNWPVGAKLYPLVRVRLESQPTQTTKTATVATSTLTFQVAEENAYDADESDLDTYLGFPVFNVEPNRVDDMDAVYSRLLDDFDNDTGLPIRVDKADRAFISQMYEWFIYGRPAYTAFKAFLYALDGRRTGVWLPTFTNDLEFVDRVSATTVSTVQQDLIEVELTGYRYAAGSTTPVTGRDQVRVTFEDGTISYHKILSCTTAGATAGTERVVLTPWLTTLSTDVVPPIKHIQFLNLMRLDSDTIELAHKADAAGLTVVQSTFKSYRKGDDAPVLALRQSGTESDVGTGVTALFEITSVHDDPFMLFSGISIFQTHNPANDGFMGGSDATDHCDLTFPVDMPSVLALGLFSADDTTAPTLSTGWTSDADGVYNKASVNYAFNAGHKSFTTGDDADVTATWADSSRRVTGCELLLNDALIVQMGANGFDIIADSGAFVTLADTPTSGNWLVQITFCSALGAPNTTSDLTWQRWFDSTPLGAALFIQVVYRKVQ